MESVQVQNLEYKNENLLAIWIKRTVILFSWILLAND